MKHCLKLVLLFYFYQIFAVVLCGGVYMLLNGTLKMPDASSSNYATFLMTSQITFSLLVILHLVQGKYVCLNRQTLAYYNSCKVVLSSIILVVGMGLWSNYLCELLELPGNEAVELLLKHPLGIFSAVVLAPIAEEFLFRGAMQGYLLRRWKKPIWAISVSALVFGVVHGNLMQLSFAFVLGLVLGWVCYRTGSLVPSMLMHFVNNGLAVLSFHVMGNEEGSIIAYFGLPAATVAAAIGMLITIGCVIYMRKNLPFTPGKWYVETNNEHELLS